MYPISEQLINYNRSHQSLSPIGFVIHSTDTPGATAQNEHDYFNSGDRQASSHYFVDATSIIRCIPESERAWHAGATANSKFLSAEMCEVSPFDQVWARTVWLVANACVRYGWATGPNVYSHRGVSEMYGETNHTDPIQFLANNGKTWDQLLSAIDTEIANIKTPTTIIQGVVKVAEVKAVDPDPDCYVVVCIRESLSTAFMAKTVTEGFACKKLTLGLLQQK